MFSRQLPRPRTSVDRNGSRINSVRPSITSQSNRSSNHNTISYEITNSFTDSRKSTIHFNSDNLNDRMNEYLNLVLQKKGKDDIDIGEDGLEEREEAR
jgi:hypothetical protein